MTQSNLGISARLAFYYFAIFIVAGVHLPFWPVWLTARGLSASDIGLLTSVTLLLRVITGPLIALASDRAGHRQAQIILFTCALGASFALFSLTDSFVTIFLVTLLTSTLIPAIMPLLDTLTLAQYTERKIDYGRVRLWGSISFIAFSTLGGYVLSQFGHTMILPMILAGCVVAVIAALLLPRQTAPVNSSPQRATLRAATHLFRNKNFLLFVAAGGLIQAAHAAYYTFGTLNWQRLGMDNSLIGILWALGVVSEIILFAFSGRLTTRFGPAQLLMLAGLAGVIRWGLTAFNPGLALLVLLQCLHAFTFGASHLAAMHFITRAVPPHLAVTAQGVYSALSIGILTGVVTYGAGFAYTHYGSLAFLGMAALCALGFLCAWRLRASWAGGELMLSSP